MRLSKPTTIATATLLAITLTACGGNPQPGSPATQKEGAASATITNCGKTATFNKPIERVVSMGVTGLAYLTAAGAQGKIVGRANERGENPPKWIEGKVGGIKLLSDDALSIEGLLSAKPDLAYGGGFDSAALAPDAVSAKGIPAIVDEAECHYYYPDQKPNESFDVILSEITKLGKLLGTSKQADQTVAELTSQLKSVSAERIGKGRTAAYAYYYGSDNELFSYGSQGVMGEISKTLDIKTAIDPNYHPHQGPLAPEAFVKSDPDMIIVMVGMGGATKESTLDRLSKIPGYQKMKAVQGNKIYFIEASVAYASPAALYGVIELAEQLKKG